MGRISKTLQKGCFELFWVLILAFSFMPRLIRYYVIKPTIASILLLIKYRRKVIVKNLTNSFPEKTAKEINSIIRRNYLYIAEVVIDTISLAGAGRRRKERMVTWEGDEEVRKKLNGKDWVAMCAHYGCWEYLLLYSIILKDSRLMAVYHPMNNFFFEMLFQRLRSIEDNVQLVPMRQTIRCFLRNRSEGYGSIVGLISDQSPDLRPNSQWFTFLNQHTAFIDGGEVLARKFGIPAYFVHCRRIAPGRYVYRFDEIYDGSEQVAPNVITQRYAQKLEAMIRECPELWLWSHNRWKFTPEVQERYYGKTTLTDHPTNQRNTLNSKPNDSIRNVNE